MVGLVPLFAAPSASAATTGAASDTLPAVGTCFVGAPQLLSPPQSVDCGLAHDAEVLGTVTLAPKRTRFPGDAKVNRLARLRCGRLVVAAAGSLPISWYHPGRAAWDRGLRDAACVVLGGAPAVGGGAATPPPQLPPAPASLVSSRPVVDLRVGECLTAVLPASRTHVDVIDCARPHEAEVIRFVDLVIPPEYPGEGSIAARAADSCNTWLTGVPNADAVRAMGVSPAALLPGSDRWINGDRRVTCLAARASAPLVGQVTAGTVR